MIKVSIVIATYNRAESLMRTLESVVAQSLDTELWEAVAVNNNSTDNTRELFEAFATAHPQCNLRMTDETVQGLSAARNRGIAESRGEYIAIIDDDELVNVDFARSYMEFFDGAPQVAAAGGRIMPMYETKPPRWLSPIAELPIAGTLDMGSEPRPMEGRRYPGGGNMCIRRTAIERYGAFNPELGRTGTKLLAGEEKDLFDRLRRGGEQIYYLPDAQIRHIIPQERLTRAYFTRLARMIGVSERIRTRSISRGAYTARLISEAIKWGATLLLALFYTLTLRPAKGGYLILLRTGISQGLITCGSDKKPL